MKEKGICAKVDGLLEKLLDGELAVRDEHWVKEELANCADCRKKLESLQKLRALVREVYIEEARSADLDGLYAGVMHKVASRHPTFSQRVADWLDRYRLRLASPLVPIGVVATVGVAVLAAVLIYVSSAPPSRTGPSEVNRNVPVAENQGVPEKSADKPLELAHTPRRPRHDEKPFKKNECYITYYNVDAGTVIIDVDPEGDDPAVVWHFAEEPGTLVEEDNRI